MVKAWRERRRANRNMTVFSPTLDLEALNTTQQMESRETLIQPSTVSDARGRQLQILLSV